MSKHCLILKKYSEIDNKEIAISDYIFWKKITPNSSSVEESRNSLEKNERAKIMLENTGLADELTKEEKDAFFKLSEDLQLEYIKKLEYFNGDEKLVYKLFDEI